MKIINEKLNFGQAIDIKKIAKIIEDSNSTDTNDFRKLFLSVYEIKDLNLKDTKKSEYYLTKLIYHITCYALENDNFRKVFKLDNDNYRISL